LRKTEIDADAAIQIRELKTRMAQKCVVIASHPRSGTHLTIDFIRRNFPIFNIQLNFWESAAALYVWLDDDAQARRSRRGLRTFDRQAILAATHQFLHISTLEQTLLDRFNPQQIIYIYPFRKFSKTIKSYAEFSNYAGQISHFLNTKDRHFGLDATVAQCLHMHAHSWLAAGAKTLNIDRLVDEPELSAEKLANLLNEPMVDRKRRLPRQKGLGGGKFGELVERLKGRESTAVIVRRKSKWIDKAESEAIDQQFCELFEILNRRCIN